MAVMGGYALPTAEIEDGGNAKLYIDCKVEKEGLQRPRNREALRCPRILYRESIEYEGR